MKGFWRLFIAVTISSSSFGAGCGPSSQRSLSASSDLGSAAELTMLVESPVGNEVSALASSSFSFTSSNDFYFILASLWGICSSFLPGSVLRASSAASIQSFCVTILVPYRILSRSTSMSLISLSEDHFSEISCVECLLLSGIYGADTIFKSPPAPASLRSCSRFIKIV